MIARHIADLLYHHECVIVPGLGGFIKACSPARILHTTHEFFPPSGSVAFNAGLSGNDGLLANYIASVENISYRDALNEIHQWVGKCISDLNHNTPVTLQGIGEIFLNTSGNIEFTPSKQVNFNADSFGLTVFFAKTNEPDTIFVPDIQPIKRSAKANSLRRLVPETLKWAAVLAPFIAFALWGTFKGNVVENYVHNYTGIYSWMRSTPGKTAPVKITASQQTSTTENKEVAQLPAAFLSGENISFDPGMVSYAELAKYDITIGDTAHVIKTEPVSEKLNYHIIGGAFRDHNNALKLIAMLQEQGYPAAIVDTTAGGLYVVSMSGFSDLTDAKTQLSEIKKAGFTSSWILKKNRS